MTWFWGDLKLGDRSWKLTIAGRILRSGVTWPFRLTWRLLRQLNQFAKAIEPLGILLAAIGLILAVVSFWIDYEDRVEERTVRAWQLLTTQASGNSGKREALEYLNRRDGLWCRVDECLLTLKERTQLVGVDLTPPDRGADGNTYDGGQGAYLVQLQLVGGDLRWANLKWANLQRANLQGADLRGANLRGANLQGADLSDAELLGAELDEADLFGAELDRANLAEASLGKANLKHASFYRANLFRANLERANLRSAYLGGAVLEGARFSGANLQRAYLGEAKIVGIVFRGFMADFRDADLSAADLSSAYGLTQKQLDQAIGDENTKIPKGLTRPKHWSQ